MSHIDEDTPSLILLSYRFSKIWWVSMLETLGALNDGLDSRYTSVHQHALVSGDFF